MLDHTAANPSASMLLIDAAMVDPDEKDLEDSDRTKGNQIAIQLNVSSESYDSEEDSDQSEDFVHKR